MTHSFSFQSFRGGELLEVMEVEVVGVMEVVEVVEMVEMVEAMVWNAQTSTEM